MILGHCSSHASCDIHTLQRVPRELHKALFPLHPVQQLFTLPGGKNPDPATRIAHTQPTYTGRSQHLIVFLVIY